MNLEIKQAIFDKICEYDKILIFRHKRPDGDATGSTKGLQRMLRLTFPQKEIYLSNVDYSDYMAFLGEEDGEIDEGFFKEALGIVIDTGTTDRISDKRYTLCRELIKIDHHIPIETYGDLQWVEEERSSACELIADFYSTFKDKLMMDCEAATYIYAGMVTDSGRFRFRSVSGETLRLAGMLLDFGVDVDTLYAHLYMKEFNTLKFKAYIYEKLERTANGVVYIMVDKAMQKKFKLSFEEACSCVSYMDSIKDSLIWIAFIETADGDIRVRLRSRFVTISELAEQYRGGGHACAAGATVLNKEELKELVGKADARLKDYKENHEGWL